MSPKPLIRNVVPAPSDPIRIVPLNLPLHLTMPPEVAQPPQLTYRGGLLLTNVEVFTIFLGQSWTKPPNLVLAQNINQFFEFILSSSLMDQLTEYSVPQYNIGRGQYVGTITITSSAQKQTISDKALQDLLQQEISTKSIPQPTTNTLYFIYLEPGVSVVQGGSKSCQAFCGYHSDIGGRIFYAVMPYPGCGGCNGASNGLTLFDALTSTSSHELWEAITDPVPGNGWYDDYHGEIGDICAWKTKKVGSYTVQLEWSNKAGTCV